MAVTVDALTLNVQSSAESAANSVGKLVTNLKGLKDLLEKTFQFKINISNDVAKAMTSSVTKAMRRTKTEINRGLNKNIVEPYQKMYEKELAQIFKGKAPASWKMVDKSGHAAGSVSKKDSMALAREFAKTYGIDTKSYSLKQMASDIQNVRSGMGRNSGANSGWATKSSASAARALAQNILETSHKGDDDLISALKGATTGIRLTQNDISELKKMNMTPSSFRSALSPMGIRVYDPAKDGQAARGLSLEEMQTASYGYHALTDSLSGVNGISDFYDKIMGTWASRSKNSMVSPEMQMQNLLQDVISRVLDSVNVRGEKIPVDSGRMAQAASDYETYLSYMKRTAEQTVKSSTIPDTGKSVKDIIADQFGGFQVNSNASKTALAAKLAGEENLALMDKGLENYKTEYAEATHEAAQATEQFAETLRSAVSEEMGRKYDTRQITSANSAQFMGKDWFQKLEMLNDYKSKGYDTTQADWDLIGEANNTWLKKTGGAGGLLGVSTLEDAAELMTSLELNAKTLNGTIDDLIGKLSTPAPKNLADSIDHILGIDRKPMTAEDWGIDAFVTEASQKIAGLFDMLEHPPKINLGEMIDQQMGIDSEVKSAKDSMDAFLQSMDDTTPVANSLRNLNPELVELKNEANAAGIKTKDLTTDMVDLDGELKQKKKDTREASDGIRKVGTSAKHASSGVSKLLSSISRIARTLFIRTALRSLMKSFSESWNAAYEYSKHMGGSFAKAIEDARGAISHVATTLIQTFAPVIASIVPIINHVAASITYLCEAIQDLLSYVGMTSELFGATSAEIDKYSASATKGANKTNNMLASFDELNVIQSESSSGTGAAAKSSFKDIIADQFDGLTNFLVDEALIGLGIVLCGMGHFGLGIGLIAVGAASIAKTLTTDWGSLSQTVKDQIAEIMAIVGVSMFAIGLVLALAGHPGMGIGMMIAGFSQVGVATALSWGGGISENVKKSIANILKIGSYLLLGTGVILMFTGHLGLGIAAFIAGGAMGIASKSINWGGDIKSKIQKICSEILPKVGTVLAAIGTILLFTGHVGLGIAAIVAGGLGIAAATVNWNAGFKENIEGIAKTLLQVGSTVLAAVGVALLFTGHPLLGIAAIVAGGLGITAASGLNGDGLKGLVSPVVDWLIDRWNAVTNAVNEALYAMGLKQRPLEEYNEEKPNNILDEVSDAGQSYINELLYSQDYRKMYERMLNGDSAQDVMDSIKDLFPDWAKWSIERRDEFNASLVKIFGVMDPAVYDMIYNYGSSIPETLAKAISEDEWYKMSLNSILTDTEMSLAEIEKIMNEKEIAAPIIETFGYEKSLEAIKEIAIIAGDDTYEILKNWKLIAPYVNEKNYNKSIIAMETLAQSTGTDIVEIMKNWEFIAPLVDNDDFRESIFDMIKLSKDSGVDIETIMQHWDLIAPYVDDEDFAESLSTMVRLSYDTGIDVVGIINNWKFIAPLIEKYGYEESAKGITKFADTTGLTAEEIISNWKFIAPAIERFGFETSAKILAKLSSDTGIDITEIISGWKLIAPLIDDADINQSIADISTAIKDAGPNWQTKLKNIKLTTNKITVPDSDVPGQVKTQAEAGQTEAKKAKNKITILTGMQDIASKTVSDFVGGVQKSVDAAGIVKIGAKLNLETNVKQAVASAASETASSAAGSSSYSIDDAVNAANGAKTAANNAKTAVSNAKTAILDDIDGLRSDLVEILNLFTHDSDDNKNWEGLGFDDGGGIIPILASGGMPQSGQLFVAREAGPELVGRIGSRTTVANNDQIVRGIEGGVARAMAPVEQRLARIEQYTGITAEKEPTVRITPSAALGRVNAQSAALYGATSGR